MRMYRCKRCSLVYALTPDDESEARDSNTDREIQCNHCKGTLEALTTTVGLDRTVHS